MNFIAIAIVAALLLGGDKINQIKEFLAKIDFKSFAPLLQILGVNKDGIDFLSSEKFEEILTGETDVKTLLPLLSTLFKQKETSEQQSQNDGGNADFVAPIKEVAPTEVEESISAYFN